jgi:hypothetical protein
VNNKRGLAMELARLDPALPVKVLDGPPREFNKAFYPTLTHVDAPQMVAYLVMDAFFGVNSASVRATGIPLSFDHKSQSFMMARQVVQGSKSVTIAAPMNNGRGNLQSRADHFSGGGGGYHGGGSSGGNYHSSGVSGSSSGSGSHGGGSGGYHGGGGSSSGGGSHGGGASSSSSSSSGGGSPSSSSSAGSSGSSAHH